MIVETKWGNVVRDDGCKDDYRTLRVYDQPPEGGSAIVLQEAAMQAFKAAEERFAKRLWRPGMPKKIMRGNRVFRPIPLTGSIRSCETQARLYNSDPPKSHSRYARPESTLHTHGLAIDVHTGFLTPFPVIRTVLLAEGWRQSRPDDEPWHFSFGFLG